MEMSWPAAGAVAALGLIAVLWWQRAVDRDAWPAWSLTFGGLRRDLVEWLRRDLARHLSMLDSTLHLARLESERGDCAEAAHVLSAADRKVGVHVGVLQAWLARCRDVAHKLSAIKPVPPLRLRGLCLGPLRVLALGQRAGDAALVTSLERFRWTTKVQSAGLVVVDWAFGASALGARSPRAADVQRALDEAGRAREDLGALNDHVVATLEHLCVSLEAGAGGTTARGDRSARAGVRRPGPPVRGAARGNHPCAAARRGPTA